MVLEMVAQYVLGISHRHLHYNRRLRRDARDATSFQGQGRAAIIHSFLQSSSTRELDKQFFSLLIS